MSRSHAASGSPYEQTIGFSRAVRAGDTIAVSGTAPVWPDGEVDPDVTAQTRRCWEIALAALAELGGAPGDVVRTRQYVVDAADAEAVGAVHGEIFGEVRPASTMVVVAGLLDPRWRVEVEVDAIVGLDRTSS
jgi:enamine deaminase RidA (YjgF/YER057c/UK114 family)